MAVGRARIGKRVSKRNAPEVPAPEPSAPLPLVSTCYAPHSALYLRPDGLVQACCTTGFEIGRIGGPQGQTLHEIWGGALLATQREHLERGSFDLGCQECEFAIAGGGRRSSLAWNFDRWAPGAPHRYPKLLDLALSNRCNLACVMCNGGLSSTIRAQREHRPPLPVVYDDRFFDELDEFLPHAERIQFKGGEPFLAPENRRIWDFLLDADLRPEITVTTNGTVYNEQIIDYVRELRMQVNLSVDGVTPGVVEEIRVGAQTEQLWANIDRFHALCSESGTAMTLSMCLLRSNWREVPRFLAEVDRRALNPNVIFVNQPWRYDLLRLPAPELDRVLEVLTSNTPALSTDECRIEWTRVLDRIRSQIDRPTTLNVQVRLGPARRAALRLGRREPVTEDRVRADAAAWSGTEPMVVTVIDEVVASFDAPPWAEWLQPDRWLGLHQSAIASEVAGVLGVDPDVSVSHSELPLVDDVRVGWDVGKEPQMLRVLVWHDAVGDEQSVKWFITQRMG